MELGASHVLHSTTPQREERDSALPLRPPDQDGVVYQSNYVPKYGQQLDVLRKHDVPYLFDPSTNRLPYSKFSETQSLRELPYVFDKMNRLTEIKLRSIAEIQRYVRAVLNWQIQHGCTYLVADRFTSARR